MSNQVSEEASLSVSGEETMEKEELEHGCNETPCEITPVLEMIDDSKNDKECELLDSNNISDDDVVIISEVITFDNHNIVDIDVEVIDEKENVEVISDEVENSSSGDARNVNENPQATISEKNEVKDSKNIGKAREEIDFVSNDAKENIDNADEKWEALRSLTESGDKYSFIRKRWGNSALPDPSIDLTYRHRCNRIQNKERSRKKKRASKGMKNVRSLSCVSHLEKLMNDVKTNYYSELEKLCARHCLIMSDMQSRYQSEFAAVMQYSLQTRNFTPEIAQMLLMKQRQDEMLQADNYQKKILNLTNKTNSCLARYEKYSEEMLTFHKQYQIDGNGLLKTEQFLHLQDTERMYKEYEKFYC